MTWSFGTSIPLLLAALAVWLGAAWLSWQNWRRRGGRAMAWLEGLRMVVVTALVFTLLRPEIVRQIQRTDTPVIAILSDASGSMQTRDLPQGTNTWSRSQWLTNALGSQFWKPLERTARVHLQEFSNPPPTNSVAEEGTDISQALELALQQHKNLKAVLLLSDGDSNLGKPPLGAATRLRDAGVPVFTVAVGRDSFLPDLILETGSTPAYGLVGEQIALPFKVTSHLSREVKTMLTVSDGAEETRREITVPADGVLQDAIVWAPTRVGEYTLTLRLPVEADEALPENNERTARMAVRSETLKVLVVESLPRWEYRYLRNALERDPGVEAHTVLFHPGMGAGGGRNYLPAFPGTKEALARYDVVFIGDVGVGDGELKPAEAELLKGLVEQQGSGLVFLPGARGRQLSLLRTSLKDIYPVQLDEARPEGVGLQNESLLLLSSAGKGHWLTRFDAAEDRNESIWKNLPGFYWSAAVEKSRPGSEVLAVHSSLRNTWGRVPLLVTRNAGSGKVLFMGTDSAWRWRRGVEDKWHYRFWSQVVRWMSHQRHLAEKQGVRLTFSPEAPQAGETVFLQATVLDAAGYPIEQGPVNGRMTSPSGRVERVDFAPVEGGWGVFKARLTANEAGAFKIHVNAPQHNRDLETSIHVSRPTREKLGQPAQSRVLREIASVTQGSAGGITDLNRLVSEISLLPEPKPLELRLRLWASPWWGGGILLLLTVYWVARKLAGMV
jgi:hypothetical protein